MKAALGFLLLFATCGLNPVSAQEAPVGVEVAPPDCGVRVRLPAGWSQIEPQTVALVLQFAQTRLGKGPSQKFPIVGIYVRGDVKGLDILRGPSLLVSVAQDFTTPESVIVGGGIFAQSLQQAVNSRLKDFYLEMTPFTIAFEPAYGSTTFSTTARSPDGTKLIASATFLPTVRKSIFFGYITPEANAPDVAREFTAALAAAQIEPGIGWTAADKEKLRVGTAEISLKSPTETYADLNRAAEQLLRERQLPAASAAYAKAVVFAQTIAAKRPADEDQWQRRACSALALQAEVLKQTPDPLSALPVADAALAVILDPQRSPLHPQEWWEIHRKVLAIKVDTLRNQDKPKAVGLRTSYIAMLKDGAAKGYGKGWIDTFISVKAKDQAYDLLSLKRIPEALAAAQDALDQSQEVLARNTNAADVGPSGNLANCWKCLADCQEASGDVATAIRSYQEALQCLEKVTTNRAPTWWPHGDFYNALRSFGNLLGRHRDLSTPDQEFAAFDKALQTAESLQKAGLFPDTEKGGLADLQRKHEEARKRLLVGK